MHLRFSCHEEDPQKATRARSKAGKVAILRHAQGHKEQAEVCCSCNRYGKKNSSSQKRIKTSASGQELQLHYEGLLETHKGTKIFLLVAINRFFFKFLSVRSLIQLMEKQGSISSRFQRENSKNIISVKSKFCPVTTKGSVALLTKTFKKTKSGADVTL